ncbi:hypothetical protein GCM10027579_18990 [Calidifontibacter terrae]
MSQLEHVCLDCDHRSAIHDPRNRSYTDCACCNGGSVRRETPPRLAPTFRLPGFVLEELCAPGSVRNAGSMHATRTCGCSECQTMYERLTAARTG